MWKDCRKEHRKTRKFETYANIEESDEDGYERGKDEAYAYYDENEGEEEDDDNDDVESDIDEQDEFQDLENAFFSLPATGGTADRDQENVIIGYVTDDPLLIDGAIALPLWGDMTAGDGSNATDNENDTDIGPDAENDEQANEDDHEDTHENEEPDTRSMGATNGSEAVQDTKFYKTSKIGGKNMIPSSISSSFGIQINRKFNSHLFIPLNF